MEMTLEWLENKYACTEGIDWFLNQSEYNFKKIIKKLMLENRYNWANWLITRLLTKEDNVRYALYAAESVLHIYEVDYPKDKRLRNAIKATKKYLETFDTAADNAADADAGFKKKIIDYGLTLIRKGK